MNKTILMLTINILIIPSYHLQASDNADHVSITFEEYDFQQPAFTLDIPQSQPIEGIAFRSEQDRAQFSPRYSQNSHMLKRFSKSDQPPSLPSPTNRTNSLCKSQKFVELFCQQNLSVEYNRSAIQTTYVPNATSSTMHNNRSDSLINQDDDYAWFKQLSKEANVHTMPALHAQPLNMSNDPSRPKSTSPFGSPTQNSSQKSWASYFCCFFFYK